MQLLRLSLLILGAATAVWGDSAVKDIQDPIAVDNNPTLWKVLYTKLNTLINETDILNHRMQDIKQKQDSQDDLIRTSFNHSQNWTPIMRRQDGSVNFYRSWEEYRKGFGNSNEEFFIGLEKLHILTTYEAPHELLVVLGDFVGESRYAKYDRFLIGSEAEKYALKELGNYEGTAGNALVKHKGMKFSTYDQDNDAHATLNCAKEYGGAWWFYSCYMCHLAGPYRVKSESTLKGVSWNEWKTKGDSLKFAEMFIRPKL